MPSSCVTRRFGIQSFRLRHNKRFALPRVGQATQGRRNIILNHSVQLLVCEHVWLALWVRVPEKTHFYGQSSSENISQ